ncbi:hypothetical protein Tco_0509639 [Tanacetum coccineum]
MDLIVSSTLAINLWSCRILLATSKAINGFDMPLPVAVCSGLVNPLAPRKGGCNTSPCLRKNLEGQLDLFLLWTSGSSSSESVNTKFLLFMIPILAIQKSSVGIAWRCACDGLGGGVGDGLGGGGDVDVGWGVGVGDGIGGGGDVDIGKRCWLLVLEWWVVGDGIGGVEVVGCVGIEQLCLSLQ